MALTVNIIAGAETGNNFEVESFSVNTQVSNSNSRNGDYSYSMAGAAGQAKFSLARGGVSDAGTSKICGFGFYINALPVSGTRLIAAFMNGDGSNWAEWELYVDDLGQLELFTGTADNTRIGSGGGSVAINTWHYIEVFHQGIAAGDYAVFLDGFEIYSGSGGDFRTGGNPGTFLQVSNPDGSHQTFVDDVYLLSDVTDKDDRWGNVEIQGFWNTVATATSTFGTNLGIGDWTCQGPGAWSSIQGEMTGSGDIGVRAVDTSSGIGASGGPNDEWGGLTDVKAYRLTYYAERSGGGGSTHSARIGGSVSRQNATAALDATPLFFDFMFTASSVNTSISTGDLSYGFGTSGGQDSECYGILVEVANAVDFVTSTPRTVTCTTEVIEFDGTNHKAIVNAERMVAQPAPEAISVAGTDADVVRASHRDVLCTTEAIELDGTNHAATVTRDRLTAGATEVVSVVGEDALIGRVPNVPREVTCTTSVLESVTTSAVNQVNRARGIPGYVARIYLFETTGNVIDTGFFDGTTWTDSGGDWLQETNIFDGAFLSTFGSNFTGQTPENITPIHATGISNVDTGRPPTKVKVRHHGTASGTWTTGPGFQCEVDYLLDGVVIGTTSVTGGVPNTDEITLPRPGGGWTWDKIDALEVDIAARATFSDSEPEVTISGIEIENWSGGGSAPPGLNKQRGVNGVTQAIAAIANSATVTRNRLTAGATEVIELDGTTHSAIVGRGLTITGIPEAITVAGTNATVERTAPRNVVCTTEEITTTENASIVNRTRVASAAPEVVTLTENASVVTRNRVASALTEVVALAANSAAIAEDRGVISAVESLILTGNAANVTFPRTVSGITEVLTLAESAATVDRAEAAPRNVIGTTEVIAAVGTSAEVNARRVVGSTVSVIAFVENAASLNMTRGVGSAVEVLQLSTDPASVVKLRNVLSATEVIAVAPNSASVVRPRSVQGVAESIVFAEAAAEVFLGVNRDVVGITESILLSTNATLVSLGRSVVGTTEQLDVLSNSATVNLGRGVLGATESALLATLTATITKTRSEAQPGSMIWAHPKLEEYVLVDGRMIQL